MEAKDHVASPKQAYNGELPSLLKYISSEPVSGFDDIEYNGGCNEKITSSVISNLEPNQTRTEEAAVIDMSADGANVQNKSSCKSEHACDNLENPNLPNHSRSVSISMPSSPSELHSGATKRVMFNNIIFIDGKSHVPSYGDTVRIQPPKQMFHSQPLYISDLKNEKYMGRNIDGGKEQRNLRQGVLRDKRFDSFKTWSGKLERQFTNLRGRPQEPVPEAAGPQKTDIEPVPVDRYFDALEGPELDTLKASEVSVLPEDKQWPFLLRFPISSFGICLGVSSQAILWKTLATSPSTAFLHVHPYVNLVLWCVSLALTATVSTIYLFKIILYFEAVKREYYHPIRVNFFFAPWIACLFLALGVPPLVAAKLHASAWYILMSPILCLELKIYGQWMSGGQRRLSKVANPSNHLSIVGNFVGALLGASMGLKEGPIFFFAIGLAHYIVLFVTLYQRLPTNETLPKELHPVFFLFVAAPSVACMAWANLRGDFDYGSRIAYFIALFLYVSLVVRINFFRGFRFSLAWWAYTFPMTGASIATIRYSTEVKHPFTQSLAILLSAVSTLTVTALLVTTILHAFILRNLFPNDISIAISKRKPKSSKRRSRLRLTRSDAKDSMDSASLNNLRPQLSV